MTKSTLEMDGFFTEEDIKSKGILVLQCRDCKSWTQHKDFDIMFPGFNACIKCKKINYDLKSVKSLRTYRPLFDNKRKPK